MHPVPRVGGGDMPIPSVKEVAMGGKFPGYYLHVIHSIQTSYLTMY